MAEDVNYRHGPSYPEKMMERGETRRGDWRSRLNGIVARSMKQYTNITL